MKPRSPLESKKFLLTVLVLMILWHLMNGEESVTVKLMALSIFGFVAVAYIGGQAYLDRYLYLIHPEPSKPEVNAATPLPPEAIQPLGE